MKLFELFFSELMHFHSSVIGAGRWLVHRLEVTLHNARVVGVVNLRNFFTTPQLSYGAYGALGDLECLKVHGFCKKVRRIRFNDGHGPVLTVNFIKQPRIIRIMI